MRLDRATFRLRCKCIGMGLISLLLSGCIIDYNPKEIEGIADILVVQGIITDDESTITISRSINMSESDRDDYVDHARVYIECDDGTLWEAASSTVGGTPRNGRYTIQTDKLNPERLYRLKIAIEDIDSMGRRTTNEYNSEFSAPIQTPEIDSVFWTKIDRGQPVTIHVTTHEPEGNVLFYRWSFKEDWEIRSLSNFNNFPPVCYAEACSSEFLLAASDKTVFGQLTEIVTEISPSDRKLSALYRIVVTQNAISKRAYTYFANIKKNVEQTGSLFTPIPSELRGNIVCTTDSERPVIGYVEVSTTTQKHRYISSSEVYEQDLTCRYYPYDVLLELNDGVIPDFYIHVPETLLPPEFVRIDCADCRYNGTELKPDDWPSN